MPSKSKTAASAGGAAYEELVRQRAYYLWEADGRPDGRAEYYWETAAAWVETAAKPPRAKAAAAVAKKSKPKAEKAATAKPAKKRGKD